MKWIISFLGSYAVYLTFFALLVLNFGYRLKHLSPLKISVRSLLVVVVVYCLTYVVGGEAPLGFFISSVGYLFGILLIGSFFDEDFFCWVGGVKKTGKKDCE